jgi:antitoxin component of MazEF toxin-antitoxin module
MSNETVGKIEQLTKTTDNTLQLLDQEGELLFECEIGDEYHQMILEVGLNKILKDAVEQWESEDEEFKTEKRGEAATKYTVDVEKADNGDAIITLPDELVEKMGWKDGDTVDVDITENCFDWGEVPSMVLRNLTKERNDNETTD